MVVIISSNCIIYCWWRYQAQIPRGDRSASFRNNHFNPYLDYSTHTHISPPVRIRTYRKHTGKLPMDPGIPLPEIEFLLESDLLKSRTLARRLAAGRPAVLRAASSPRSFLRAPAARRFAAVDRPAVSTPISPRLQGGGPGVRSAPVRAQDDRA